MADQKNSDSDITKDDIKTEPSVKKRKIHMTDIDIEEYEKTCSGSAALTHPVSISKSSRDPNRGLYPRASWKRSGSANNLQCTVSKSAPENFGLTLGFQKASASLNPTLPFEALANSSFQSILYSSQGSSSPQKSKAKRSVMRSPIKKAEGKNSIIYYTVPTAPHTNLNSSATPTKKDEKCILEEASCKGNVVTSLFQPKPSSRLAKGKESQTRCRKKEPKFNRDNAFLYSKTPDPLSMGIKSHEANVDSDSSCDSNCELAYFERLPLEVVENIFCRLPIIDLCLNLTVVCKDWRDIIHNQQFIPWKKMYYKIKMSGCATECEAYKEFIGLMRRNKMTSLDSYLYQLIRYMSGYKLARPEVSLSLCKHSKYEWAHELMKERFPDCIKDEVPNPWSMIATICILSDKVYVISEMIDCLLAGKSYLMAIDIIESLYCIATFLLCFKSLKYGDVWTHMHYRVYYALYLFENDSTYTSNQLQSIFKSSRGQQSLVRYSTNREMELTHEQLRIVKFDPQEGAFAKIVAFAGTGKTTTLVKYAQLRPNKRFLFLVFNKSVNDHAAKIFPANVVCKTGHSLAFGPVGSRYKNAGCFGNLTVGKVVQLITPRKGISLFVQAKFIINTLNGYMSSADELITTAHVPLTTLRENGKLEAIDHEMQMKIAEDAEKVWERMKDLNDKKAVMSHDGYLKLYQLRKPKLHGYDMILVDEAQDLTPAMLDIVSNQKQPKILVGDPHQQIYSFRGAINAMELVQSTHTFYLTQSFRFGPEIAFVANCALEFFKGEKKRSLVGNARDCGILGDTEGQIAIITRTNFTLFTEAVKKCCYSNDNIRVAFAGGIHSFGFPMITAIYALMLPPGQRKYHQERDLQANPLIRNFENMGALEKYATQTQDSELLGKIKIVRTYTHTLPSLIEGILKKTVSIIETADIIFSTAHKAKGLEFNTVMLTDDYNAVPNSATFQIVPRNRENKDEANLLYVAVTRAKRRLVLTPSLLTLLDVSGENFLHVVHSKSVMKTEANCDTFKCAITGRDFKPCALTLKKHTIKLFDGTSQDGGMLCPQVVREESPSLRSLFGSLDDERSTVEGSQGEPASQHFNDFVCRAGRGLAGWAIDVGLMGFEEIELPYQF